MFNSNTIFSGIVGIGTVQRQSIVSLIWQIAITFIGFFSTMYFACAVGADVFGAFFRFMVYFIIIVLMTDGGFEGLILKYDRKIYDELKVLMMQMNVGWPKWM